MKFGVIMLVSFMAMVLYLILTGVATWTDLVKAVYAFPFAIPLIEYKREEVNYERYNENKST